MNGGTSLSTSHDERIMDSKKQLQKQSKGKVQGAMARCSAKFCELTDANFGIGDNFQSP